MPRKAKEKEEKNTEKTSISKTTTKKVVTKKEPAKKTTTKKAVAKKEPAKKTTTKKAVTKKETAKKTTTKKTVAKKETAKKTTTKKVATKKTVAKKAVVEYYDLPERYNQTIVKILAQTPKTLFIYWEISDEDILKFKNQYGQDFFETTRPVLIVHNYTLNYEFEVEINDFANSWYLHVDDSKSDYKIELGRRFFKENNSNYIYVAESNQIESPNDHILFDPNQKMIYFRNVKTGKETAKDISTISFIKNIGKIYNIYDLYKKLYKDEDNIDSFSNPSSHTSSQFK